MALSIRQFFDKYDDQYVEVGGSPAAVNQCVDLANRYLIDVVGHEPILGTNADDFPSKCMDFCDWYPNTPEGVPEQGDLLIWDMGSYGHIAIYDRGSASNFISFDQNYPLKTPCHFQFHDYNNLTGYLRPRKEQTMTRGEVEDLENKMSATDQHQHSVRWALITMNGSADESQVIKDSNTNGDIQAYRKKLIEAKCPACPPNDCTALQDKLKKCSHITTVETHYFIDWSAISKWWKNLWKK